MSFFALGGGSEATRPTFFELVAAQQLVPTLKEATIYSLSVLAQGRPWWYRLLQYDDEIFVLLTALLDHSSLSSSGGTFAESLYSLRRAGADSAASRNPAAASDGGGGNPDSTAQATAPHLTRSQRRKALLLSVLLPYLHAKLSALYVRNRSAPAALPGLESAPSQPQYEPQQQQQQQQHGRLVSPARHAQSLDINSLEGWDIRIARLRERLRSAAIDAFLKAYPLVHAVQEGSKFMFQLLYLLERTPFYNPALWLLGQRIVRISGSELAASERRVARSRESALQRARQTGNLILRLLRLGYLRASYLFTDHTRNALILSVFAFEALRWWYTTAEGKLAELGKRPPPPPPPPPLPHPVGVGLPTDPGQCPICRRQRTNPALLEVSGYAFCYPCLHGYLERNGCCPVSRFPATEEHIRRVYPDV